MLLPKIYFTAENFPDYGISYCISTLERCSALGSCVVEFVVCLPLSPLFKLRLFFKSLLQLKAFASGSVSGSSITSYKAYALPWDDTAGNNTNNIFHKSHIILSIVVAMLNIFIFSFSLGICSNLYDAIYSEIKCKKNPYYPLFWSVVFLSMLWNIGPSWLVLSLDSPHIRYSLVAMIPVQFILAMFMKKYPEFPIPGMQWWSLPQKLWKRLLSELGEVDMDTPPPQKNFFWEVCKLKSPARAIVSFVFQTIAIWSLLVLFMFVVYYGLTVAISLYLYPIQTLVKILFIKAIAICAVFDVALLFSGQSLDYHCSRKAWLVNITLLSQTLAVFSFIPVLAFLAYTIGGVLFSAPASQLNGVQGIIALLPSAFLVLVGWYSRGTLFPEKFPHDEAGHGSVQQNTNGYQPPIDHSDSSQHHSSGHTTAIKLEQEIKELTNRESGSSGPHTSEQTPLLPDKKS